MSSRSTLSAAIRRLHVVTRALSATPISPTIKVEPSDALIDEPVAISVTGLRRYQKVTLSARLENDRNEFLSCAHYTADVAGHVNTLIQPSEGCSFTGIEPMGLFWSMVPSTKHKRKGISLLKKDVTSPYVVTISVLPDHKGLTSVPTHTSSVLASTEVRRWYMGPGVQRLVVREGRLRGTLFTPPGDGPFPAVLDLYVGSGGFIDFRGALLASRGFLALSLAYFLCDDLPTDYDDIDFYYFQEAADWLSEHPKATPGGIGVIGTSFGGMLTYLLAAHCPQVRAAVSVNGHVVSPLSDMVIDGHFVKGYMPVTIPDKDGVHAKTSFGLESGDIEMLKIWRQDVKILALLSEDDKVFYSNITKQLLARVPRDKQHNIHSVFYPGAGHLLEPPYTPLCTESYIGGKYGLVFRWGGDSKSHATAQEDAWRRALEHFNTHLTPSDNM